ncbi:hypothetical protein JCM3770_002049 [Rhodotorula araucariae]
MSGFGDPYRHPRDDRRDHRDERGAGRGGRGDYSGDRHGYGDGREGSFDDRGYGGGGRGRGWGDDRDPKRGRYEDYDRGRASPYGRDDYPPPRQQGYSTPPTQSFDPYTQPAYPPPPPQQQHQHQHQHQHQPQTGYAAAPGAQVEAAATPAPRPKGPVQPEAPSASVILLGLPPHATDVHVRQFLENMGASIDSTTVIIDRATGVSKQFGFAKFSSVEHARAFIEPNFPSIPWREPSGPAQYDGMRVKVNYSQKSGGWREDQGATARLTDDQRKAEGAPQGFYVNDGTRDIGATPSNILLLRGLDPLTSEEEIAGALARVGGRANQAIARGGIKRVMVAKDRASRSSWGFAFVQFDDIRLATDVLAAVFNPQFHPAGFRIRNAVVAASFSHENSFIPVYATSTWSFRSDGGAQLAYWDDKGFVTPWIPPPPPDTKELLKGVPKGPRAHEEALAEADLAAFFADLPPMENDAAVDVSAAALGADAAAASAATSTSAPAGPPAAPRPTAATQPAIATQPTIAAPPAPLPAPGSLGPITIKPIASVPSALAASSAPSASSSSRAEKPTKPAAPAAAASAASAAALGVKEKKNDLIASRKAAPNIAKWNVKAKEIRAPASGAAPPAAPKAAAAAAQPAQLPSATVPAPVAAAAPAPADLADAEFEHGDPVAFTNLANPSAVAASATRKAASLAKHAAVAAPAKPKYVDRAAARREVHGATEDGPAGPGAKKRKFDGPEPPLPAGEAPNKDGLEESNAGRKMLEKMGWTAGAGLGAAGDGRVDPVQAAQFQQGAGLGSTKGVAVGTEEPKTYAEKLRLKALERFEGA